METTLSDIINVLSLLAGGGGISFFFTLRWARSKAKAEADRAVAEAMQAQAEAKKSEISADKERQDYYQQLLDDFHQHHEELRQERDHYKQERNEYRERQEQLTRSFIEWRLQADNDRSNMKMDIAHLGQKVEAMRPFICGDLRCKRRQRVTISDEGVVEPADNGTANTDTDNTANNDIEPIDSNAL